MGASVSGVQEVTVTSAEAGQRLDRWMKRRFPGVTQGQVQKWLRKGQVRLNGGRVKADHRVESGEVVRVPPIDPEAAAPPPSRPVVGPAEAEMMRGLVIYEDDDILALNKPAGLAVQGGAKTLIHIDGMLDVFGEGEARPRLVHRLDRDTGGVLLLAKSRAVAATLSLAFQQHRIGKTYWAITKGVPHPLFGRIDMRIEKAGEPGREKMRGTEQGQSALTDYQTVETAGQKAAFLALRPHTGRTHQIRVHLSAIGTPIVGDRKYGGAGAVLEGLPNQMHLFCRQMHVPRRGRPPLVVTADLTGGMATSWSIFGFSRPDDLEWPDE
ncbi:Ribosomal large subunit pseudouridine synthase C [Parvularcula bermudensis HTCC2503]|uniref:Ribosomal large subunit pseudouridine synthase C n=1 Tax=Parvularcula bermudensis (strain ATCC BAA-594 / HTCC2503 / KCTC 12087) TaxID=314260 RepID=E0TB41_PARBH|nr:Ribosomal large subunit pseudouridine synthase C [Parvularcula bermudensis HTCC2503]